MSKSKEQELNELMSELKSELKTNLTEPSRIIVEQFLIIAKYNQETATALAKSILDALLNDCSKN
jgi:hypothetical protein